MIQQFNDKKYDLCLSNFTLYSIIVKWPWELYESQLHMMNIILRHVLFLKDALKLRSSSYTFKFFFIKTHHSSTFIFI